MEMASDVWRVVRERFSQGDLMRVAALREEIFNFKQENASVVEYFTGLTTFWEELENYRPLPMCQCSAKTYREQNRVIRFLRGLNDDFSVVTRQEKQSATGTIDDSTILILVNAVEKRKPYGRGRRSGSGGRGTSKVCTYCKKLGHTIDVCYRKHGFPPGFKFRNSTVNNTMGEAEESFDEFQQETPKGNSHDSSFSFTPDQYRSLLALIQHSDAKPPSSSTNQLSTSRVSHLPTENLVSMRDASHEGFQKSYHIAISMMKRGSQYMAPINNVEGYCVEIQVVKMHDLVRAMAINIIKVNCHFMVMMHEYFKIGDVYAYPIPILI